MFRFLNRREVVQTMLAPPNVSIAQHAVLLTAPGVAMMRKNYREISNVPLILIRPYQISGPVPMCRLIYDNDTASKWHAYDNTKRKAVAIETYAPGPNGEPRWAYLKIG